MCRQAQPQLQTQLALLIEYHAALSAQFGKDSTSGGPSTGNVQYDPAEVAQFRDPIFDAVYSVRSTLDASLRFTRGRA